MLQINAFRLAFVRRRSAVAQGTKNKTPQNLFWYVIFPFVFMQEHWGAAVQINQI